MAVLNAAFLAGFCLISAPLVYLYALAIASYRSPRTRASARPHHRFAIAIAAHDEESVIGETVERLKQLDYPAGLFDIHVVADHCSDRTAEFARSNGADAHERSDDPRGSKGAALRWLFERILDHTSYSGPAGPYDAVVIFDADTHVEPDFLRLMDARLLGGDKVIQGQHRIRNPRDGWFPALTWAMFTIDNRLQNLGRSNLGLSAKNMGDSICLRAELLRRLGWGEGLTEDYAFRQQLLLQGIKISYEPAAIGLGEAPLTWAAARAQRARWLRGAHDASQQYARKLLTQAVRRRSLPLLDGALQAHLPAYSTLTMLAAGILGLQVGLLAFLRDAPTSAALLQVVGLWSFLTAALFVYPLFGLALERAPLRAYMVILSGPVFIIWRTWLAVVSRRRNKQVHWVRTPRRAQMDLKA
jgi:cellulose synthase/poly-beta-1,6-N-acetylglucosamine synthase-like glycosyltransferase